MKKCLVAVVAAAMAAGMWAGTASAAQAGATSRSAGKRLARIRIILTKLDLTADQKAKVKEIVKDARASAQKATDRKAKIEIWKNAFKTIKMTVLTDQQRKKLHEILNHLRRAHTQASSHTG